MIVTVKNAASHVTRSPHVHNVLHWNENARIGKENTFVVDSHEQSMTVYT